MNPQPVLSMFFTIFANPKFNIRKTNNETPINRENYLIIFSVLFI
jgi:hypothetical protein